MKRIYHLLIFLFFVDLISAQTASNFTIVDTDNNTIRLYEDLLDQDKIVVIDLFFVVCPICEPYNLPFQQLYEEFGEGNEDVEFLLLTTKDWDNNASVANYRTGYGITYPGSGTDGGGLNAAQPYINGEFGSFFGAPTYIVIAPNRKVFFNVGGGGVSATMDKIRSKILEVRSGISEGNQTFVEVNLAHYKPGTPIPNHKIYLRSATDHNNNYEVPANFLYPSDQYPQLNDPEIYIEIPQIDNNDISTFDLFTVQRNLLGLEPFDNFQKLASDVNGSSSVAASDLLLMRKLILGLETQFPVNKSFLTLRTACGEDFMQCVETAKLDTSLESQDINFTVIKIGDVR